MDLAERIFTFLIGAGVGAVVGYIVARLRCIEKKLEVMDRHVLHPERGEDGYLKFRWLTFANVALSLVVILVAYAAFSAQSAVDAVKKNTHLNFVSVCQAASQIREVQRQTVDAIYQLATQSLERPEGAKPLTDVQLKQYNDYIDRVNFFRTDMYNKIHPTKACEPYVTDENVNPPTADFAHIKRKP